MPPLLLAFLGFLAGIATGGYVTLNSNGKYFVHNNHRVFLSGANTAWVSYGQDFGNDQYRHRRDRYLYLMEQVKNAGGNSMRTWVHVEGVTSPKFNSSGFVTGLDNDGTFISDFRRYLDDAQHRNILIFPTLWNGALKQDHEHLQALIESGPKLQSYIDHALIPWVRAVKDHPALGGWDIINEMEGFIIPGRHHAERCYDTTFLDNSGAGWAGATYTAHQLLRFINWQAHAIRRTDPSALVTAGSWSQKSQTDMWHNKNIYADRCLVMAGGREQGFLTFYSTHSYDWQREFSADAVFKHNVTDYLLDKPLVIAEFNSHRGGGMSIEAMFQYAYTHGYHGAWSWHANADGSDSDPTNVQMRGIASLRNRHGSAGTVAMQLS